MIDSTALDHEEEALVAVLSGFRQCFQRSRCHLAQAWINIGHVPAVDLKGHVVAGEQTKDRQRCIIAALEAVEACAVIIIRPPVLLLSDPCNIHII